MKIIARYYYIFAIILALLLLSAWMQTYVVQAVPLIQSADDSIVKIKGSSCEQNPNCGHENGNGAIVHPSGIVLTALHVIVSKNLSNDWFDRGCKENLNSSDYYRKIEVTIKNDTYTATRIAEDQCGDIALLQIDLDKSGNRVDLPSLKIATADQLPIGPVEVSVKLHSNGEILTNIENATLPANKNVPFEIVEPFNKGDSGAPIIAEIDQKPQVIGVLSRANGQARSFGSTVQHLEQIAWEQGVPRMWLDDIKIDREKITSTLHAIGLNSSNIQLVMYPFDSELCQMLYIPNTLEQRKESVDAIVDHPIHMQTMAWFI